ncbi:hypothetical protein [Tautonia plasticadhaerens]|uniref:Uncharacterized protein n=1 Tax=Tautonia plasticadhaerens TaxID=2527974 RepID=A0A518HC72_9BACT|nr:hypothetical protein [Tautonia plasticadhaerens]QDV38462.1 hypothetical protein ElP_64170 [Tautonia plasticadhaerens]
MSMTLCLVARTIPDSCPITTVFRALADSGHEAHVILVPTGVDEPSGVVAGGRLILHHLPAGRSGWYRIGTDRARRASIARLLLRLSPQVVHVSDESGRGIARPPGAIVLQSVTGRPTSLPSDAEVLPDGRFLDRTGRPIATHGVPPMPAGSPVDDGLAPDASETQWRVLTYLASIDQLRRERRVRIDPGHRDVPRSRLASALPAAPSYSAVS